MEEENTSTSPEPPPIGQKEGSISTAVIEEEMKTAYLDYAMSVIIGRALPDARDGLKPVHRRILYAMNEMGVVYNKPFKKSARIVGEVLGKFHPHGDSAVYDALVRMAQEFSLRYPLVSGQGNFGSVDGDSAAAMRYTEARLAKISETVLADIDKETVVFRPNFDESLNEPTVLPTRLPNLLINGSNGIAVGMATNIPPHNLSEVVDATIHLLEHEEAMVDELLIHIKGPDFPTGGIIIGKNNLLHAYHKGKGKIKLRSVFEDEAVRGKQALIVTEIPYQVNKSALLEQIAEAVRERKIEGISDIRDESNRKGLRIVIELKKDANKEVVKNQLLKHSRLQTTMGLTFLALVDNQPKTLNLKESLSVFIDHRKNVIIKRTNFDLNKAKKKAHILEGLTIALNHLDAVIALIKKAKTTTEAKERLEGEYSLSTEQAQAILDMKLQRLTGLEREKIKEDYTATLKLINELKAILESEQLVKNIIKQELLDIKEVYGDQRRTEISSAEDEVIEDEDLIPQEYQVITITKSGYAKRQAISSYKLQNRGGRGVIGTGMKEEDVIQHLFIANTHSSLLIFTSKGKVHWLKVYKLPEGSRQAKGKALINLINLEQEESVAAVIPVKEFDDTHNLLIATRKGIIKKTSLEAYSRPRQAGIKGITLDQGDSVVDVRMTDGKQNILLATKKGQAIKFSEQDARSIGRTSRGVKGIQLAENDEVINMSIVKDNHTIFTITENGYGKRTPVNDYRLINRGGKGVRNIICSQRNGNVSGVHAVTGEEELLLISQTGIIIRVNANQISTIGRNTQGLRVMKLSPGDKVKSVALVKKDNLNSADNGQTTPE